MNSADLKSYEFGKGSPRMAFTQHLVGWVALAETGCDRAGAEKITACLRALGDDFGQAKTIACRNGLGFGVARPEVPLPMATWSLYEDSEALCFVEGVFYGNYGAHAPLSGEDQGLARLVLQRFRDLGARSIAGLNGAFCGVMLDFQKRRLMTFVDRLGVRVLYWMQTNGRTVVSSKLGVFKQLTNVTLDTTAAFQALTVGFPIGRRTLIEGVDIQSPCTVRTLAGQATTSSRYWHAPQRLARLAAKDAAAMISAAMDHTVERFANRARQPIAIGLTGGHDSRVILGSLVHKQVPFTPTMWADGDFNDVVAPCLAALANKIPLMVGPASDCQIWKMKQDVFRYSDGSYFHSTGFARLGRECFRAKISCLVLGFGGDKIGGLAMVPALHHLPTAEKLARAVLKNQMELLSFAEAGALLGKATVDLEARTLSEWADGFDLPESSSLVDAAIWQAIINRNFKRVRPQMVPATQYVQLLFPYLDNDVLETYFRLPIRLIHHQRAHCYAGFYRIPGFGKYQACSYPISLHHEARFPSALYGLRLMVAKMKPLRSRWSIRHPAPPWSDYQRRIWREIFDGSLFDEATLRRMFDGGRLSSRALHALHTLHRFQQAYV